MNKYANGLVVNVHYTMTKQHILACFNLSQSFSGQSTGGGDSGTKIKSASEITPLTTAKYL